MRLTVRHRTSWRYDAPISAAIQLLRLTPRTYDGLKLVRWRVWSDRHPVLPVFVDGFGNITHCHSVERSDGGTTVFVDGEVETAPTHGIVRGTFEPLPPLFFLRETPLTRADAAIRTLAQDVARDGSVLKRLHALVTVVRERIDSRAGAGDDETTAAAALACGQGTCQDHAHVFIAAARLLDIPARYASGYLWTGVEAPETEASHAWAEAFVHDLGWVGFDPANRICPTEAYIRTSIGLDSRAAAPTRSVQRGSAAELRDVTVKISQSGAEQ